MFCRSRKNPKPCFAELRRDRALQLAALLFTLALAAQAAFWNYTRAIKPEMGIVASVPGERSVKALSLGDEETFFRLLALNIQTSGDTFGRFTALYKYDFNKLYHWFRLLDGLNRQSNYLPAMASYYFSQTQNPSDVRYIVDYLDAYASDRVKEKWWWLVQASYLATHKLGDKDRALEIAEKLRGVRGIPIWAQQMAAFIHEQRGEFGEALAIMEDILKHPEDFTQGELNFMQYFIGERLNRLEHVEKQLNEIRTEKERQKALGMPEPKLMGPPSDVGAPHALDMGPN